MGLHPNTIRSHLRRLEAAGLAVSETETRTSRGRPRLLFEPGPGAEEVVDGARDYKLLSAMLAGHAKSGASDPSAMAESTGKAWGGYLAAPDRPRPGDTVDEDAAVEMIARMMDRLGFEPEVERAETGTEVLLHNSEEATLEDVFFELTGSEAS